jgi:hypothetical protein
MRLWSLHPRYLDAKGLQAVWREGLLAKKVLQGNIGFLFQNIDKMLSINPRHFLAQRRQENQFLF